MTFGSLKHGHDFEVGDILLIRDGVNNVSERVFVLDISLSTNVELNRLWGTTWHVQIWSLTKNERDYISYIDGHPKEWIEVEHRLKENP